MCVCRAGPQPASCVDTSDMSMCMTFFRQRDNNKSRGKSGSSLSENIVLALHRACHHTPGVNHG